MGRLTRGETRVIAGTPRSGVTGLGLRRRGCTCSWLRRFARFCWRSACGCTAGEHEHEYDTKLVEVFIGRLRKKIGDPPLIHTVRYVGYTIRKPTRAA